MKFFKTSIFAISISMNVFQVMAQGGLNPVRTAVPFLTIAPDSRSSAMGDVGVATTPDANSLHWNPAKYAFIESNGGVSLSYSPWLRKLVDDMNLMYLSGYWRIDKMQVIAASLEYSDLGDIMFYDMTGQYITNGKPNEFSIDMAYSRKFSEKISAALAFRYIRSDLASGVTQTAGMKAKAGNSFAADVAVYYNSDLQIGGKNGTWALGLDISNIGNKMSYSNEQEKSFLPTNLRLGGSIGINFDEFNKITLAADINKLLVPTPPSTIDGVSKGKNPDVGLVQGIFQSFYDAPGGFSEELHEISYGVGLEYFYKEVFAIRGGYYYEHPTKGNRKYFTMGVGIRMNVIDIDFSYLIPTYSNNPLANTLRFTLVFNFGHKA